MLICSAHFCHHAHKNLCYSSRYGADDGFGALADESIASLQHQLLEAREEAVDADEDSKRPASSGGSTPGQHRVCRLLEKTTAGSAAALAERPMTEAETRRARQPLRSIALRTSMLSDSPQNSKRSVAEADQRS